MEENIFKRACYEILENTISIYLGINERDNNFDIIRIIGDKDKNINSIEDYIKEEKRSSNYGYKIFVAFNVFYQDFFDEYNEEINKGKLEKIIKSKLFGLEKKFVANNSMIKHISKFTHDNYGLDVEDCLIDNEDNNFATIIYDGYIITTIDLIGYIIAFLNKNNIILEEESSLTPDDTQLCRRF